MTVDPARRALLAGLGASLAAYVLPPLPVRASGTREYDLTAEPARVPLVGDRGPATAVWAFNGRTPGPVIRARQGDRLRVRFDNRLDQPSTVHWHGIRLPNAMDGVPFLTQPPVAPGKSFTYEFPADDAGTFWYHPHFNSSEQIGRGLAGALIVDEAGPPMVDRDLLWVIGDWRLDEKAALAPFGASFHDMAHGGRLGNTVTVNGQVADAVPVRPGERLRLRLVNVANARIFRLNFTGHRPWLIAIDGHPIPPRRFNEGQLVIAPGARADLVIDMEGRPGDRLSVVDQPHETERYRLVDFAYTETPLQGVARADPAMLAANPVPEPDLGGPVTRLALDMEGGAMGGMESALFKGEKLAIRDLVRRHGMVWSFNGVAYPPMKYGEKQDPMFTFKRGETMVLRLRNKTAFAHPIHLHGHAFRVLARDGKADPGRPFQDTVLINPDGEAEIAFVATPGDWMLHCHILEHQMAGMMGYVRVA